MICLFLQLLRRKIIKICGKIVHKRGFLWFFKQYFSQKHYFCKVKVINLTVNNQ